MAAEKTDFKEVVQKTWHVVGPSRPVSTETVSTDAERIENEASVVFG